MFWIVLIIIVVVMIIWDVINGITKRAGKKMGISDEEINQMLDLWALLHIGKDKKD